MSGASFAQSIGLIATSTPVVPCQRCETLPSKLEGPGTLLLRFPMSHSFSKVLAALTHDGLRFSRDSTMLSIEVGEDLASLARTLGSSLSSIEREDVRVLFQPHSRVPLLDDYFNIESLNRFIARAGGNWLLDMMKEDRLTNHFQPIVEMQSGEVFAYECLLRGEENGALVPPGKIFETARYMGLLFQIDLAARRVAIRNSALQGITSKIFVNFTPTAIYDPANCLRSTVALCEECGLRPDQMVFEIIETDQVDDISHLTSILDFYRSRGFGIALDDLGAGHSSLDMMRKLKPDYVKLDRDIISGVHLDPFKASIARQMFEAAHKIGVKTVAEGVETIEELEWVRQHGADYAQGFLLARPAFPPPAPHWPL